MTMRRTDESLADIGQLRSTWLREITCKLVVRGLADWEPDLYTLNLVTHSLLTAGASVSKRDNTKQARARDGCHARKVISLVRYDSPACSICVKVLSYVTATFVHLHPTKTPSINCGGQMGFTYSTQSIPE